MIKPHHYGFAAYELYGNAAPALVTNDVGVFFAGDTDALIPAPQELLDLAARIALRESIPAKVSYRQFFQALFKRDLITLSEAEAAIGSGVTPAAMQRAIDNVPAAALPPGITRDDVNLTIRGATTFERAHIFTGLISAAFGWDEGQTDEFWRYAASLP